MNHVWSEIDQSKLINLSALSKREREKEFVFGKTINWWMSKDLLRGTEKCGKGKGNASG